MEKEVDSRLLSSLWRMDKAATAVITQLWVRDDSQSWGLSWRTLLFLSPSCWHLSSSYSMRVLGGSLVLAHFNGICSVWPDQTCWERNQSHDFNSPLSQLKLHLGRRYPKGNSGWSTPRDGLSGDARVLAGQGNLLLPIVKHSKHIIQKGVRFHVLERNPEAETEV